MKLFTRRQALLYSASIAIAAFAPEFASASATSRPVAAVAIQLFGKLETRASAAIIGREYLRRYPSENSAEALLGSLDFLTGRKLPDVDDTALARLYAERIAHDFACADVVNVDGWVLSRTEARVFGLLSLHTPDPVTATY